MSSSSSAPSPYLAFYDLDRQLRKQADDLATSALKLEKSIKALKEKETKKINDIKFHKLEMERQEGYFLADGDTLAKLEKALRRIRFDINIKEEEAATNKVQTKDILLKIDENDKSEYEEWERRRAEEEKAHLEEEKARREEEERRRQAWAQLTPEEQERRNNEFYRKKDEEMRRLGLIY